KRTKFMEKCLNAINKIKRKINKTAYIDNLLRREIDSNLFEDLVECYAIISWSFLLVHFLLIIYFLFCQYFN
ncbi:MAG: hypothetical protein ACXW07_10730, partial [Nitrososphaeraceae archaeon]